MTGDNGKIAVLEDRIDRQRADLHRVFNRVDTVEKVQSESALDRVRDESKYDEMSAQIESLKNTVELAVRGIAKVDKEIDKRLEIIQKTVISTQLEISSMNGRVMVLESEKFDLVKVFRWLGTWRGTFFMIVMFAMIIGAVFPGAREWISSLLGIAARTVY